MKSNLHLYTIIIFFLFINSLLAQPSLFFTEKEVRFIQKNIFLNNKVKETGENSKILHLSSLIYIDESHWTLWLNDQILHATDSPQIDGFHIEKVTPFSVEFSYLLPQSTIPLKFTLCPHQIYWGGKNRILRK